MRDLIEQEFRSTIGGAAAGSGGGTELPPDLYPIDPYNVPPAGTGGAPPVGGGNNWQV
ncbi:MAG: hypothetical protein AB7V26_03260 [Lysobacterales bacterium]